MLDSDGRRTEGGVEIPRDGIKSDRLEHIYKAEAPRLLRLFRRRARGADEPADLLQEVFARLAGCNPQALLRNPEAYLQRIVRNLLIDRSRRAESRLEHIPIGPDFELPVAADQSYAIEVDDVKRQYKRAVEDLPPRTREVFLLHRVEDLSYKEIAERLCISIRTVEWHVGEALVRIGRALDAE